MKLIIQIIAIGWLILLSSFNSTAIAASYACINDSTTVNSLLNSGQVVVQRITKSSCSGNIQLKFNFPSTSSTTIACYPSNPDNLPNGYVVIEKENYSSCDVGSIKYGYKIKRPSSTSTTRICDLPGTKIPTNFAVTKKNISTSSCDTNTDVSNTEAMEIKKPSTNSGTNTLDCQLPIHDLPAGFVITRYSKTSTCASNTSIDGVARNITIPRNDRTTTVCQTSPIPAGFSYFGTGSYSGCGTTGSGSGQGFKIGPVTGTTANICGNVDAHIPAGYVVTAVSEFGNCDGSYKSLSIKIPASTGTIAACRLGANYLLPSGYIVTSLDNNTGCGNYSGYDLKKPSGSSEFICQTQSPLPDGWGVTSQSTSANCAVSGSGPSAVIAPLTGNGPYAVCSNTTIPAGFVVNKEINLWSCTSNRGVSILRPSENRGTETIVCSSFLENNIPMGFVIVERDNDSQCSRVGQGYKITKPPLTGNTLVCTVGTNMPEGFVVSETGLYPACGIGLSDGQGAIISLLSGNGPFYTCLGTPIPAGYVVTKNQDSYSHCGGGLGNEIRLPNTTGTTNICEGTPVPTGYIVNELNSNSACGLNRGWSIRLPSITGSTFMCSATNVDIPIGYIKVVGTERNYSSCAHSGEGLGFSIIPEGEQAIVPSPFVNVEADVISKPSDPSVICSVGSIDGGVLGIAEKNSAGCN